MEKIRVLRILNRFNVGGPIYNATYLTKYLNKQKYETLLIGGIWEDHEESGIYILKNENIKYKVILSMKRKISFFNDIKSIIVIMKIINDFKPHIIHTHASKAGLIGRLSSIISLHKSYLVHTYHGNVFDGYFNKWFKKIIVLTERILAKKTNKIISISNKQKSDLVNKYKISNDKKVQIIPLGFKLNSFNKFNVDDIKKEFNIKNDEIIITIIGRIVPIKNHKLFIEVFNFCKLNTKKKIKALVVGDGSEKRKNIKYAESLGLKVGFNPLRDNEDYDILFTSWRKDINNILGISDIICLTSLNEGTPVSIIEAMASNTVCISTDVGGVSDIISHSYDGYISNRSNSDYSQLLLKLIENDIIRKKFSKRGYNKVINRYNYDILVRNIEKLYDKLN